MELRLLGPIELWSNGKRVDLGARKQRCVLAVLAWSVATAVPTETLIDHVWGGTPPREVRGALYTYIARLRRVLAAATNGGAGTVLRKEPAGYVLGIDPDVVDVHRFRTTIGAARRADDDPARAALLREALALWRGTPLSGTSGQWVDSVRTSLEQLRLDAMGDRIDLELRSGIPSTELIGELTSELAERPLAERFAGQLMVALGRSGRHAEALTVYERLRTHLRDELGTDPGPQLRRLHRQLLGRDPAAESAAVAAVQPDAARAVQPDAARAVPPDAGRAPRSDVPRQLPIPRTIFVGREAELRRARDTLTAEDGGATALVAIWGPGGVGKSALALRVAHSLAARYPDGQLYVDLQGSSPGLSPLSAYEALRRVLRALGTPAGAVPDEPAEAAGTLRSLLAERHVLLVLDNATDPAQVLPLLPANPCCAVVVTSRIRLSIPGDAYHIGLGVLAPEDSVALLGALDPTGRLTADPALAGELAALCGQLPLALQVVAARVASRPAWPLATFVERLTDERYRLDRLGHHNTSVRACFEVSYRTLLTGDPVDEMSARAFRLLGLPDGPDISLPIAARLLDLAPPRAEGALDRLADAQLLDSPAPGRYRMHDLVRLYARELAHREITEAVRRSALGRIWRCYVATATHAVQLLGMHRQVRLAEIDPAHTLPLADRRAAQEWLEDEAANLTSAARQAAATDGELQTTTVQLAFVLFDFMHINAHWRELRDINLAALQIARTRRGRSAEAQVLNDLGVLAWREGDGDKVVRLFGQSLDIRRETGDRSGEAHSLHNLAAAYYEQGESARALECLSTALAIWRRAHNRSDEARALRALGEVHRRLGQLELATEDIQCSLAIYRALGKTFGEAQCLQSLGAAHIERGQPAEAISCLEEALAINRDFGAAVKIASDLVDLAAAYRLANDSQRALEADHEALTLSRQTAIPREEALALYGIGRSLALQGHADMALDHWRKALPIFERLGLPEAANVRRLLSADAAPPADQRRGRAPVANRATP